MGPLRRCGGQASPGSFGRRPYASDRIDRERAEDLESLEETLDILSNQAAMRAISKAETDIGKGKALTADELRARYLAR